MISAGSAFALAACHPSESGILGARDLGFMLCPTVVWRPPWRRRRHRGGLQPSHHFTPAPAPPGPAVALIGSSDVFSPGTVPPAFTGLSLATSSVDAQAPRQMSAASRSIARR